MHNSLEILYFPCITPITDYMWRAYNNDFGEPVCVWLCDNSRRRHKAAYSVGIAATIVQK